MPINTLIFLIGLWIVPHLLILGAIKDSSVRTLVLLAVGASLLLCYSVKPYTYDLNKYSVYFETGFIPTLAIRETEEHKIEMELEELTGEAYKGYEEGFNWAVKVTRMIFPKGALVPRFDVNFGDFENRDIVRADALVFFLMAITFAILIYTIKSIIRWSSVDSDTFKYSVTIPIILGSLFYLLGSQNVLRQFLAVVFLMPSILMIAKRQYLFALIIVIVTFFFHRWAVVFGVILGFLTIISITKDYWESKKLLSIRLPLEIVIISASGAVVMTMWILSYTQIISSDIHWMFDEIKQYLLAEDISSKIERVNTYIKLVLVLTVLLISEVVMGKIRPSDKLNIRVLRRLTFCFTLPFVLYPEIWSRLLFFYLSIEMLFVVWAMSQTNIRVRLSGALVFCGYGFAPNAINVVIGPQWLYSL